jgi:hypothetical protein
MKNIVFSILTVLALTNCGSSDDSGGGVPGTGMKALDDTQKQQASRFNNSLADVSALTEAQETSNGSAASPITIDSSDTLTKAQQELVDKMDWAKNNYYCFVDNNGSVLDQGSMEEPSVIQLNVSGSDCPISYKSVTKSTPSVSGNTYSQSIATKEEFKINPYGVVDLNLDILSSNTTTTSKVNFVGVSETTAQVTAVIKGIITAQSKSVGAVVTDIAISTSMTQEFSSTSFDMIIKNMTMSVTVTQTYADFKVVAYVVMNVPQEALTATSTNIEKYATFYINGKKVSATEFAQVFGDVKFSTATGFTI